MLIDVMKSKIHRVKVTQTELHYVGSISIDENLMVAADISENEKVQVVNINNGERLETYVMNGKPGSGDICLNGPAARRVQVGDVIIIISYCLIDKLEAKSHKPLLIFTDENNKLS